MFDIAWTELLIIAVVAILVVGPRELPRMLLGLGKFMGQVRRTAGDFQRQFNDALREAELDDLKRDMDAVRKANPLNKIKDDLNPLKQAGDSVRKAVEDPGAPRPAASGSAAGAASSGGAMAAPSKPATGADHAAEATASVAARRAAATQAKAGANGPKPSGAKPQPAAKPAAPAKTGTASAAKPKAADKPKPAAKPKSTTKPATRAAARGAPKPGPAG